jgi:hypothetical protein
MRTALLCAQKDSGDLKDWLISTFLPDMIIKKFHETQPALWEGIIYSLNKFYSHKMIDKPLTLLINDANISQITELVKGAPSIKSSIQNLLKTLSEPRLSLITDILNDNIDPAAAASVSDNPKPKRQKK